MTIIHELKKPGGDLVRLMLTEYRGKRYADIRLWADKGSEGHIATKKGVTVPLDSLDGFAEAFAKAAALARSDGS
ncbi:MAG: hypothetical protein DCC73_01815 [Proteobacteria bacterium]|nr:MAG: hypothetical protein DCC73_01815 [Pseudomonadota bacterium]